MITFESVSKVFPGGVHAVKDLSLAVKRGETLVLLGTSGSGKTTTMRMVNRLEEPTDGRILLGGKDIMDCNAIELRRSIGYAIQHIGLFPHMTIAANIAVVPRLLRWDRQRIENRVDELLRLVNLDPESFRNRYPSQLSGGQRQRVGVARALAADPPVVLMDEPFGALDPITREQLQTEFLELESDIDKTILFVTHDVFEAVRMGDRIALLDDGTLQQLATPAELVEKPANEFVDQFLGQHRFQLSMLTRRVAALMDTEDDCSPGPGTRPKASISARHSVVEALDVFKRTRLNALPVYRRNEYLGNLTRQALHSAVAELLGGKGVEPCAD